MAWQKTQALEHGWVAQGWRLKWVWPPARCDREGQDNLRLHDLHNGSKMGLSHRSILWTKLYITSLTSLENRENLPALSRAGCMRSGASPRFNIVFGSKACLSVFLQSLSASLVALGVSGLSFGGQALAQVQVDGYYRSNGTYVQPHQRTAPDRTRSNNYSYPGNYNPNTGRTTGGGSGGSGGSGGYGSGNGGLWFR